MIHWVSMMIDESNRKAVPGCDSGDCSIIEYCAFVLLIQQFETKNMLIKLLHFRE